MAKKKATRLPSLFDDVGVGVAEVIRPAVDAAARTSAPSKSKETWQEETPDRSRWEMKGVGEVEVRGASSLMIWYSIAGTCEPQTKIPRDEFLKKARRRHADDV